MSTSLERRKKILKELNPQQRDAVKKTLDQPSLVIAGAGSGKTKVLTSRIAYLIEKGVSPRNILAVTFTNKAANEMRERVAKVVGEKNAQMLTMGTFHSLCVRWLHQFHEEAGLKKNWTIYDEDDANKVLKGVLKTLGLPHKAENVKGYKSYISNLKNDMVSAAAFKKKAYHNFEKEAAEVYEMYQERLKQNNALDFDDLLFYMVRVLEDDLTVRKWFQKRFNWIMVDEYQDTNECQYRIVKRIAGKVNNLFVVGDDYQSIYGWRGANIEKILNFTKDYPDAEVFKLEQNYRSTQIIVEAGNKLMENADKQMKKTCFSQRIRGEKIKTHEAFTDADEASFIAQEIHNLVTFAGYKYKDFAILYRTNVQSRLIEEKLMYYRIPYNMVSGFSFYERKEIKDVLAWLQLAVNPDNDIACERILGLMPGIGKTTIEAMINQQKKQKSASLYSIVENYKAKMLKTQAALAALTQTIVRLNSIYEAGKDYSDTPISDMMNLVFDHTGYLENLKSTKDKDDERRYDNVMELVRMAKEYEESSSSPDIQDFLDQIAIASQSDNIDDEDKVQMMTLHTSKGLEFPVVFFAGFEENAVPHVSTIEDPDLVAEELRLAYVGVTRAKDLLYLTWAKRRMMWDRTWQDRGPSEFLDRIPLYLREEV